MGFVGVYTAVYDYQPQADGELEIREGDLLYILEKSTEDDWWKAKKKADSAEEEEPVGLVPNNYIQEAQPINTAKALYDYTRQTDEEVSFSEDAEMVVYDTSDPDWTLVGVNGDFGFAPSNYIELLGKTPESTTTPATTAPTTTAATTAPPTTTTAAAEPEQTQSPAAPTPPEPTPPVLPERPMQTEPEEQQPSELSSSAAVQSPTAAAIAGILHKQHGSVSSHGTARPVPPPPTTEEEDEGPKPALPRRPPSQPDDSPEVRPEPPPKPSPPRIARPEPPQLQRTRESEGGIHESPPYNRAGYRGDHSPASPSGYRIYNISEMISVLGKRKKMPTTLGINVATGTIFIWPDGSGDSGYQEWTADKLAHYSIEGKHVFLELVKPSKSIDFHAGAKDTAHEIVSALGEIAGAYKAEGLREVIAAGRGGKVQKRGQILYDFVAQSDDEVTVTVGDEVIILDSSKSEDWWMVRRLKNGREGVVPSSYVEITGIIDQPESMKGANAGRSHVEQNRLEEERLAKEAARKSRTDLVESPQHQHHKREKSDKHRSKPNPAKTRNWTDRTGTFTVEAEFLGLHDGKIHLHKMNGVKIAVPTSKMSVEDLEYVERLTGVSLDEDKPLSDIRRRSMQAKEKEREREKDKGREAKVGAQKKEPEYDWFDFFLKAGVGPHQCERYAQNFIKDSMDESVLPDITPDTLRTLGLKEGDILRVMRHLDNMFGRTGNKARGRNVSFGGEEVVGNSESAGGLFSGPGGVLRNNTGRSRPTPSVQTSDVVDPKAFESKDKQPEKKDEKPDKPPATDKPVPKVFDDDAWEVKRPATTAPEATSASASAPASTTTTNEPAKTLTGAMADLSLLQPPLTPTPATSAPAQASTAATTTTATTTAAPAPAPVQQPQPTGANPSFFAQLGPLNPQQTARQRPAPPQNFTQNTLLPPPPQRPLSAPQDSQPSQFAPPPLQPQLTGMPMNAPPVAPPGQSLSELNAQRFQQTQAQFLQPQPTGLQPQPTGFMPQPTGLQPQPTGFGQPQLQMQPPQQQFMPSLAPQPTGFGGFSAAPPQQPMATGINSRLPPPLQPQPTGINGTTSPSSLSPPPATAPLQPQKTGPPPPVRFGVKQEPKKLTPQPTGLRANLAQATPSNPFGFS